MIRSSDSADNARSIKLIDIDFLWAIEGDEARAIGWKYSINQLVRGEIPLADQDRVAKDLATVLYWRSFYAEFVGREEEMLAHDSCLIHVWEPSLRGKRIADGFHRLVAAKLAGLKVIGAVLAPKFSIDQTIRWPLGRASRSKMFPV